MAAQALEILAADDADQVSLCRGKSEHHEEYQRR